MKEEKSYCTCGHGTITPHEVNTNNCCRHLVPVEDEPTNFRKVPQEFNGGTVMIEICDVGNSWCSAFDLKNNRGYSLHKSGRWSKPKRQGKSHFEKYA